MYSETVLEHFRNPRNTGIIPDASGIGFDADPSGCEQMKIYIKVKDNRIEDIKLQTVGCPATIASCSMVTEIAKGKTIEEALAITGTEVAKALGGLPGRKIYYSGLAANVLHKAIDDHKRKLGAG